MAEPHIVLLGASGLVGSAVLRQLQGHAPGDHPHPHLHPHLHVLVHRRRPAALPSGAKAFTGALSALPAGLLPQAPHVVIHCASKQIDTDGSGFAVNLRGIAHLSTQLNAHTRAVLFVSSASVYGDRAPQPSDESAPLRPATALARSRADCEAHLQQLTGGPQRGGHCRVEVFRPRFVLGLGDAHVLPGLARLTQRGLSLGLGSQRFSIIDVDDFARILLARAHAALHTAPPPTFDAFNVGYERSISLQEMQALLCEHFALAPPQRRIPVSARTLQLLSHVPLAALQKQLQRLSLLGLPHQLSVHHLARQLPAPWLGRDPRTVVRRATQWLPQLSPAYGWTH